MTNDPHDPHGVDPETLAAYVDGRLTADERAAVEARLAAHEDSYELLVELMRTQDALEARSQRAAASPRPRLMWIGGALAAAAAALVLAVRLMPLSSDRSNEPFAALVNAVNGERYVEPRLTGGFPSGPIRSTTRGPGSTPGSTDPATRGITAPSSSQNLDLLIAVVKAQQQAQAEPSARNLHAWGVGLVLLGSLDDAIETLESASTTEPGNAAILSDLAAAYAVRAAGTSSARDWSNALDRSERALRQPDAPLEAAFNRALALEALQLDGARAAWQDYLNRDASSEWAGEARERLSRLSAKPQGSRRGDNDTAIRAALDSGADAAVLEQVVRRDPQRTREWLEEELTREWATAVIARDGARETRARTHGQRLITAYNAIAQDTLPGEALSHLWSRVHDRVAVATGVLQFTEAATALREDRLLDSSAAVGRALPLLRSAQSPLALWARYFVALDQSQQGRFQDALPGLNALGDVAAQKGYTTLAATVHNRRGTVFGRQGNQEGAVRERLAAIALFENAADVDQVAAMHALIAEAYRLLGDVHSAWRHHGESLNRLANAPNHRSRHQVLVQAGLTATFEGHLDAANAFQRQVIDNGREWQRASGTSTGLLQLARNSFRLGRSDDAEAAIRDAKDLAAGITDTAFRNRLEQEILGVEAEVFGTREPAVGLPMLDTAVERFSQRGFAVRLSSLLLSRGRLHMKAGDSQAAESDWQRAADALEAERATVSAESLRLAQAGSLRALHREMAFARVRSGGSAAESLEPIERGRARTLVEDALKIAGPAVDLQRLQQQLDPATGVLHYAIGDAEAVAWLTTHQQILATRLPIAAARLNMLIDRHRRLSSRGTSLEQERASARELYAALIAPLGSAIGQLKSLIIVPDPALAGVSFAALNNPATGEYLIESLTVAMAPSATLMSSPAVPSQKSGVLLVGVDRPRDMPALPWVAAELARLSTVHGDARLLTGSRATRESLFSEAPRAAVIHFAGHAVGSPSNPLLSRLVLHPGSDGRGDLYAYELSSVDVSGAMVVLAACSTGYSGGGAADDDGVLAMARPFLARGARAVLATYRDVSDSGAAELMERFHRHLKSGMTPAQAWQATAVQSLRAGGSSEWMSYAVFLGRGSLATTSARSVTED